MKGIKELDIRSVKAIQVQQHESKVSDSWSRDGLVTVDSFLRKMTLQDFPIPITELGWFGSPNILGTNKTKRTFSFRNRIA